MLFGGKNEFQEPYAPVKLLAVGLVISLTITVGEFSSEVPSHPFIPIVISTSRFRLTVGALEEPIPCDFGETENHTVT